jgi:DNA-binding response OmpR family regulator
MTPSDTPEPIQVLMIDDEPKICMIIKKGLELVGDFNVEVAHSGKDGLRKARRHRPDLILLDLCMPEMDGMTVLKELKSSYPSVDIPVIVLSALTDQPTKQACSYEYGEEYIEKPVDIHTLKDQIESILKRLKWWPKPPSTQS